jgi:hypothetical protein
MGFIKHDQLIETTLHSANLVRANQEESQRVIAIEKRLSKIDHHNSARLENVGEVDAMRIGQVAGSKREPLVSRGTACASELGDSLPKRSD